MGQTTLEEKESGNTVAAVNCYFMSQDGSMFKAQVPFSPYFYLQIKVRAGVAIIHHIPSSCNSHPIVDSAKILDVLGLSPKLNAGRRMDFPSSQHPSHYC